MNEFLDFVVFSLFSDHQEYFTSALDGNRLIEMLDEGKTQMAAELTFSLAVHEGTDYRVWGREEELEL